MDEMPDAIDAAYKERNQVVAALAKCFPSGIAKTAIEGWDEAWHNCVYIDLPTGQASWHYHDRDAYLFEGLPSYTEEWDGHSTPEKYERLHALTVATVDQEVREALKVSTKVLTAIFDLMPDLTKELKSQILARIDINHEALLSAAQSPKACERTQKLVEVLQKVDKILQIPAAEYVPAISDVFAIIDEALNEYRYRKVGSFNGKEFGEWLDSLDEK